MINFPVDLLKNKKNVMIAASVVAVVALYLYFNFLLMPQLKWLTGAIARTGETRTNLARVEGDISKIGKYKSNIELYKEKIEGYEKMLPGEREIPSLLENLSKLAKEANVKIVGITPALSARGDKDKNQTYQEIPILISAKSGYHELGKFLNSLEKSDRFMKVADIEIKSGAATPKKHEVELLVLTYVLLEGKK